MATVSQDKDCYAVSECIVNDVFMLLSSKPEMLKQDDPGKLLTVLVKEKMIARKKRLAGREPEESDKYNRTMKLLCNNYGLLDTGRIMNLSLSAKELTVFCRYYVDGYSLSALAQRLKIEKDSLEKALDQIVRKIQASR